MQRPVADSQANRIACFKAVASLIRALDANRDRTMTRRELQELFSRCEVAFSAHVSGHEPMDTSGHCTRSELEKAWHYVADGDPVAAIETLRSLKQRLSIVVPEERQEPPEPQLPQSEESAPSRPSTTALVTSPPALPQQFSLENELANIHIKATRGEISIVDAKEMVAMLASAKKHQLALANSEQDQALQIRSRQFRQTLLQWGCVYASVICGLDLLFPHLFIALTPFRDLQALAVVATYVLGGNAAKLLPRALRAFGEALESKDE